MGLLGTDFNDVHAAIARWEPENATCERDCQESLAGFLRETFPGARISQEYGVGRQRIDIHVKYGGALQRLWSGDTCYIELKYGLRSRSQLQRAIGQLDIYVRDNVIPLCLVLCGGTPDSLVDELQDAVRGKNEALKTMVIDDDHVRLVVVE